MSMKLTKDKIKLYKEIGDNLQNHVIKYFEEFIKCDGSYILEGWYIRNTEYDEIEIHYSCSDHNGNNYYEETIVTIDELNGIIEEDRIDDLIIEPEDDYDNLKCKCGGDFIFDNIVLTSLPPQYPYTCNKCGKKIIMRNNRTFYDPGMTPLTGTIYLSDAISLNDCDPRTVKCVLTNNGIDTNIITNC